MKKKLLFASLALSVGCLTGGGKIMAESSGWDAIYTQTQFNSHEWEAITESTTQGKILGGGSSTTKYYYVTKSLSFTNNRTDNGGNGNSGLKIQGTVYLYVPTGITITCEGANADGRTGAGAGIELSSGNTLYIIGGGTVKATGGSAANGRNGGSGGNASGDNGDHIWTGKGGDGGNGGGGAGAGIGTRGGTGGTGGSGGSSQYHNTDSEINGTSGSNGSAGSTAGAMGTLYVENGTTINATGGAAASSGGTGGSAGRGYVYDGYSNNDSASGGGGGGGGGFGGAASNIGTGGPGGGGGGGGAGGMQDYRSNSYGGVYDVTAPGGLAGQNANGTWASNGSDADARSWYYVEGGSMGSDDWNSASGACSPGSPGNGVSCGSAASNGTQNTGTKTYTITYNQIKPEAKITSVIYSPSVGTSITLPKNEDGYQWVLSTYGKSCAPEGTEASEYATASKKYYGGNVSEELRTILLSHVYGDLVFQEIATRCTLWNGDEDDAITNKQAIQEFKAWGYPVTVRLQNRTLYRDGKLNTICLPFDMTKDQIADSPLKGGIFYKMIGSKSGYYQNGKSVDESYNYPILYFHFEQVNLNSENLVAGTPYLAKWEESDNRTADGNYVDNTDDGGSRHEVDFENVTLKEDEASGVVGNATSFGNITFQGTFELSNNLEGQGFLVLGGNNKLYYPESAINVGACRAYFKIPEAAYASGAKIFMGFNDGETTSIQTMTIATGNQTQQGSGRIYNLQGQRLSAPQKGLNIINGKKVVIK